MYKQTMKYLFHAATHADSNQRHSQCSMCHQHIQGYKQRKAYILSIHSS